MENLVSVALTAVDNSNETVTEKLSCIKLVIVGWSLYGEYVKAYYGN